MPPRAAPSGQKHGVDGVDDAVRGHDIGRDHVGVLDRHARAGRVDMHGLAIDGGVADLAAGEGFGRRDARDDVVGQDLDELVAVLRLEQVLDRALGQRGESLVRRCEDGERAGTLQRVDETRGGNGGDERREVIVRRRDIDDVVARHWRTGGKRPGDGESCGGFEECSAIHGCPP